MSDEIAVYGYILHFRDVSLPINIGHCKIRFIPDSDRELHNVDLRYKDQLRDINEIRRRSKRLTINDCIFLQSCWAYTNNGINRLNYFDIRDQCRQDRNVQLEEYYLGNTTLTKEEIVTKIEDFRTTEYTVENFNQVTKMCSDFCYDLAKECNVDTTPFSNINRVSYVLRWIPFAGMICDKIYGRRTCAQSCGCA